MRGARDLIASERGIWCVGLALVALVLVMLEILTGDQWVSFMQLVTITLLGAKTASRIAEKRVAQTPSP